MMRTRSLVHASTLLLPLAACEQAQPGAVARQNAALIYGEDNREELYELTSEQLRAHLAHSVIALIPKAALVSNPPLADAPMLGGRADFCSEQPFVQQPAAALCTGVLLDWDLILTAGHCVRAVGLDQMVAVFGYHYAAPGELALSSQTIYGLSEIVAERLDPAGATPRLDYAWIRLDHEVEPPLRPLAMARSLAQSAQPLIVAATSDGLPLKIDRAATVRDVGAPAHDFFVADSDTSHGASGGVALDEQFAVLGTLSRGGEDWVATERGCLESARQPSEAPAREQFTYAAQSREGLCATPTDSSLCRADCGDPCKALPRSPPASGCAIAATPGHKGAQWALAVAWLVLLSGRRRSAAPNASRLSTNRAARTPRALGDSSSA